MATNNPAASPVHIVAVVSDFVAKTRFRVLNPEGVRRLQKVLPLILKAVDDQRDVEQVLTRLLSIVAAVLKRSAYLVLLSENPVTLQRRVNLVSRSEPITQKLLGSPAHPSYSTSCYSPNAS